MLTRRQVFASCCQQRLDVGFAPSPLCLNLSVPAPPLISRFVIRHKSAIVMRLQNSCWDNKLSQDELRGGDDHSCTHVPPGRDHLANPSRLNADGVEIISSQRDDGYFASIGDLNDLQQRAPCRKTVILNSTTDSSGS